MYTHQKQIEYSGTPLETATKAIIMIHGRGATAHSIMSLNRFLKLENTAIVAPQATNHSWYPYSFLAPVEDNQPALDSALSLLAAIVGDLTEKGFGKKDLFFLGFSQGACLALEFTARNASQYGGLIAFTGGLIGEELNRSLYTGDFSGTPALITTGDPDPHVPIERVKESTAILESMNARVELQIFKDKLHTIQMEEIELANQTILKKRIS